MTKGKPSNALIAAARRELKRRAAAAGLAPFVTFTYPAYEMGWVHAEICATLDRFLADVAAKRGPRLIICLPPRAGKSELISRRFPAYALGRFPDMSIIATSYSAELSTGFSKDVQRIIDSDEYAAVFPDVTISGKGKPGAGFMRQADKFEIVDHRGAYLSAGVGGSITGRGADILIVDDPLSNWDDARSQKVRDSLWDWYTSTAYTRLSPGGGVIVMCTRWHLDDLIGRLIAAQNEGQGDTWEVVNYPAIAEHDEPHRKCGEALHPERFPLSELLQKKKAVGAKVWASLYQQHPVPDGGALFKSEWLRYWKPEDLPGRYDAMCASWDMTFKDSAGSDYVVGQIWGRKAANFYLLDQVRGRMDFVRTREAFEALAAKWPQVHRKLVEDKANGPAIISALRERITGIVPITPKESKESRAAAVTTFFEAGNVYLPPPDLYPWVKSELIPELLSFPAAAHDDQVDCVSQALNDLKGSGWRINPRLLRR